MRHCVNIIIFGSPRTFWWDWMVPLESRERFGEGVPAQIAGTYRFPGNSRGIPREYATKTYVQVQYVHTVVNVACTRY